MVAIPNKMDKVENKQPTISDGESTTDSDSDGSDIPGLEDNTGAMGPGGDGKECLILVSPRIYK